MRKLFKTACTLFILSFIILPAHGQNGGGNLFIIGGGNRPDYLIKDMLETADLHSGDLIVILPMASSTPEASSGEIRNQIRQFTANPITTLSFNSNNVNNKDLTDSLSEARLIYIVGGSQTKFMKVVLNTPVYTAIHRAFDNGGTIAGTSAGAAVMSKIMITGKNKIKKAENKDEKGFLHIWYNYVQTATGLGLLPDLNIIDQHFIKRARQNRLISVLADFPRYQCIGIDESTAIVCHGKNARVIGEGQVTIMADPKDLTKPSEGRIVHFSEIRLSLLTAGDKFQLR